MKGWISAAGIGLLLLGGMAAEAQPSAGKSQKPARPLPSEAMGVELGSVPEVRLPPLDREKLLREDETAQGRGKVLRNGVGREVRIAARDGRWYDVAGGRRLWAGEIVSSGALGLRLHFQGTLPAGGEMAVYPPAEKERREIHQSFPGGESEFWTGSFSGERARIEYLAPPGTGSRELPFTVDRLQHLYR